MESLRWRTGSCWNSFTSPQLTSASLSSWCGSSQRRRATCTWMAQVRLPSRGVVRNRWEMRMGVARQNRHWSKTGNLVVGWLGTGGSECSFDYTGEASSWVEWLGTGENGWLGTGGNGWSGTGGNGWLGTGGNGWLWTGGNWWLGTGGNGWLGTGENGYDLTTQVRLAVEVGS